MDITLNKTTGKLICQRTGLVYNKNYQSIRAVSNRLSNIPAQDIEYFKCVDCDAGFAKGPLNNYILCNQNKITVCPWCRPDTKPNMYGRGA